MREDKQKELTDFKDKINQTLKDIRSDCVIGTTQVEEAGKHVTEIC